MILYDLMRGQNKSILINRFLFSNYFLLSKIILFYLLRVLFFNETKLNDKTKSYIGMCLKIFLKKTKPKFEKFRKKIKINNFL